MAPPASTATVPALASVSDAPPPATSSEIRSTSESPREDPEAAAVTSGIGVSAVAAARSVARARCTSWRSALPEQPEVARHLLLRVAARPPSGSSASRWRSAAPASEASVWRIDRAALELVVAGVGDRRSASVAARRTS